MRPAVEVRPAVGDDLPGVASLCVEARHESASGAQFCAPDEDRLVRHLSVLLTIPGGHVLVALLEGRPVGFVLARSLDPHLFADEPSLYVEAIYVGSEARRRGVGHALLSATAELAASSGATHVYSVPIPGSRGVQRFLARLGFGPVAGHRVVQTAVLQRRLATDLAPSRKGTRSLEDLIARRRRARTETMSGPVDLREFQAEYRRRTGVVTPVEERETLPG
ncbi:GNAT family N-acetyltransferase [Cellulosimicrobium protaetiae]|uniref:GNAT family N-acetyltransferase n=1 Tax=Cellulosimicrobium protaetiae TaxID=2587808 RepID=A0A6M5UDS8_9MICO|nr:GNAT family N-acetyltransferase [Cellulosimicrobium protaetiae]QJW36676.1 GNAT family N-acetyltransferase [Cellulosimicrobium protaetiae]